MIDLFDQIKKAYLELPSIFDKFTSEDWTLAFFPCTEFEDQKNMIFLGNANPIRTQPDERKVKWAMYYHDRLAENYEVFCKMVMVAYKRNLKLVVENPKGTCHYLTRYFPIKPAIIDADRTKHGDKFKKPTQYWFLNCEPKNSLQCEYYTIKRSTRVEDVSHDRSKLRSEITPEYAGWFIDEYIGVNDG